MDTAALLRNVLDAANRQQLDAVTALVAEDFEGVVPSSMSAEPDVYTGRDGVRRYYQSFWEVVEDLTWHVDAIEQHGEWIIARGHSHGRGRVSGLAIDNEVVLACQSRDGLLTRMRAFPDMQTARAWLVDPSGA